MPPRITVKDKPLPAPVVDKTKVLSSIEIIEAMKGFKPKPSGAVGGRLSAALQKLLDKPPALKGQATQRFDGRTIPVVVAIVRDPDGVTRAGMLVRLVQDGELKDHTRTNARGIALLRLPRPKAGAGDIKGQLEVLAPGVTPKQLDVTVPGGQQHIIKEIVFAELPPPAAAAASTTDLDDEDAETPKVRALLATAAPSVPIQDNPLDRLPADFSTDLCADLTQLLGAGEDPILGQLGSATDFRRRKVPLVKRLTIPRIGDNPIGDKNPPRRYLVRVRQQWTPLGYTLGELANVDALDPGAIINEATDSVQHLTERVARTLDTVTSQALDSTTSTLRQASSIDSLLDIATKTETFAAAGGFGLALGPLLIGGGGGYGKVAVNATTTSRVDTSLLINSSLQVARSALNQALRTSVTQLRDVQNTVTKVLGQISPLLSKVTNLLRWTLYENYIVCTHVEDVVEIQDVKLLDQLPAVAAGSYLFTDEEIVEYRRIFEPRLLEPRLAPQFEVLRRAVALKRAATLPVSVVHMSFDYSAVFAGADLTISVGGDTRTVTLRPGGSRVYESFRLQTPQSMPLAGTTVPALSVTITLNVRADLGRFTFPGFNINFPGSVTLSHANFRLESSPGVSLERYIDLGTAMRVTTDGSTVAAEILSVQVPPPAVYTDGDPLFKHIDTNRHYYYGVLAQAALAEPALRDDARLLRDVFPGDHDLWRLPIIGFEGDRALVISDADTNIAAVNADVTRFLADAGAATLIQLAAPGAYAEALEGLLSLTDAVGKLHPNLLPPPATVLAPVLPLTSGLAGGTGALPVGGGVLSGTGTGTGGLGGVGGTGTGGAGGLGGLGGLGGGLPTP